MLAVDGTSKLSAYIKFGLLSIREAVFRTREIIKRLHVSDELENCNSWLNELTPQNVKSTVKGATESVSNALGNVVGETGSAIENVVEAVKKKSEKAIPDVKEAVQKGTEVINNVKETSQNVKTVTDKVTPNK